jgi:hypothetical protein
VAWALGDWLVFGRQHYPSRYRDALDATQLDYQTLRNYAWVAGRIPPSRRRDTLSFQHHATVASLSEVEQELWLSRADRLGWSRSRLRTELAARDTREHDPSVVLRIAVTAPREARWRQAATASDKGLGDWLAQTVDAAAEHLTPARARRATPPRPRRGGRPAVSRAGNGRGS